MAKIKYGDGRSGAPVQAKAAHAGPSPCLTWWRTKRAEEVDVEATRSMRVSLTTIGILGENRWRLAATGDAAAAIGIVVGLRKSDASKPVFDVVMTALAATAADGNAAACVVMANVLRTMPGAGAAEARIATSWLFRAFASHGAGVRSNAGEVS